MFRFAFIVLTLFSLTFCGEAQKSTANLSNDAFKSALKDSNVVLLDVRTAGEFSQGHIPGALNIDIYKPNFRDQILNLDKSKTYLIYCRTGSRSTNALRFMQQSGFSEVSHLQQGIVRWNGMVVKD